MAFTLTVTETSVATTGLTGSRNYKIISVLDEKVLAISDINLIDVITGIEMDTVSQEWNIEIVNTDYYKIISNSSDKSLDVKWNGINDGDKINQYTYYGYENQQWIIEEVTEGIYKITGKYSGKVMEIVNGVLVQSTYIGSYGQHWKLNNLDN